MAGTWQFSAGLCSFYDKEVISALKCDMENNLHVCAVATFVWFVG